MRTRHQYNTETDYVTVVELAEMLDVSPAEVREKVAQAIEAVLPNGDTFEARLGLSTAAHIARAVTP